MSKNELTKLQRATLQAAAIRNDLSAWPVRGKVNVGTATRTVKRLIRMGFVVEKPAIAKAPVWREDDEGRPLMAIISDDGLEAIGMLPVGKTGRRSSTGGKKGAVAADKAVVADVSGGEPRAPRAGTKLAVMAELVGREEGATIEEMVAATKWQAHSVRGAMSGALVKKFGLTIGSEKIEGRGRTYRQHR